MTWKRIARKMAVSLALGAVGAHGGHHVAGALEGFLGITDEAADKLIDGALMAAGGSVGGWIGNELDSVFVSQFPPNDPKTGDLWKNKLTNEIRVWTGNEWQPVRFREI